MKMEIAGETDNLFNTNNSHIIIMTLNIILEAHWSIFIGNSSKLSICFDRDELSRGLKMLGGSEERINFRLNIFDILGISQACEKES